MSFLTCLCQISVTPTHTLVAQTLQPTFLSAHECSHCNMPLFPLHIARSMVYPSVKHCKEGLIGSRCQAPMAAGSGTPAYMAPELFCNGSVHSSCSDLWALGCVLYECRAGRPPFTGTLLQDLINDIETADPPKLNGELLVAPGVRLQHDHGGL